PHAPPLTEIVEGGFALHGPAAGARGPHAVERGLSGGEDRWRSPAAGDERQRAAQQQSATDGAAGPPPRRIRRTVLSWRHHPCKVSNRAASKEGTSTRVGTTPTPNRSHRRASSAPS